MIASNAQYLAANELFCPNGCQSSHVMKSAIAIDLLILRWHFLSGFVPTVTPPYAADDCLCPLIDVNMLDADMLVAAVPEATECLHLP
jgi:hypothetical protein